MRPVFLMILAFLLQNPASQAERAGIKSRGRIEGIVRTADLQAGIPEVQVSLSSLGTSPQGTPIQMSTATDADGRFVFVDLVEGRYNLRAQRKGYFRVSATDDISQPETTISATVIEDATTQITMVLIQGGIISGLIRDEQGRPAAGVTVEALRMRYQDGNRTYAISGSSTDGSATTSRTDDRGEYRLFWLPPGEYFIRTDSASLTAPPISAIRRFPQATFYPGTTNDTHALPVRVDPGQEAHAVDFYIEYAPGFTVSGKVTLAVPLAGMQQRPLRLFQIVRQSAGPSDSAPLITNSVSTTNSDRTEFDFELQGIAPGSYYLLPLMDLGPRDAGRPPNYYSTRIPVQVIDRNVADLRGEIHLYPDLKLQVILKGSTSHDQATATATPLIRLVPQQPLGLVVPSWILSQMNVDGVLTFPNLFPSLYKIRISPIPSGYYLSDISQGPVSLYSDAVVNVTSSEAPPIEVFLSTGGGRIRGMVRDRLGQPVAARVVLVPRQSVRSNGMLYKRAVSNAQTGQFELVDIAPGEYKLFAWSSLTTGAEENAEVIAKYDVSGRAVRIETGTSLSDVLLEVIYP